MVINEIIFLWAFAIMAILGIPLVIWLSIKDIPSVKQARKDYFNGPLMSDDETTPEKESILNRILQSFAVAFALGGILHDIPTLYVIGLIGWLPVLLFTPSFKSIVAVAIHIIFHALAVALVIGMAFWATETPLQLLTSQFIWLGLIAITVIALTIKYLLGHFRANLPSSPPL